MPDGRTQKVRVERVERAAPATATVDAGAISASVVYRVVPLSTRVMPVSPTSPEAFLVLDTVFPKHLTDANECRPHRGAISWTDLDMLDHAMWLSGQFVPTVEQRVRGSFTAPGTREVLYLMPIHFCAASDFAFRAFAIFDAPANDELVHGPPKLRFAEANPASEDWRFLAVADGGPAPVHFLVGSVNWDGTLAGVSEISFNRSLFASAPTGASESFGPDEAAQRAILRAEWRDPAPFTVVARLPTPRPNGCSVFIVSDDASDDGPRIHLIEGACQMPETGAVASCVASPR
jgi:hypothetical protein